MRKNIVRIFALAVLAGIFGLPSRATDIPLYPVGPVTTIANISWGGSGPGNFNNNYYFVPATSNESVCVYVYNNNTTNAHTFLGQMSISGNPSANAPSDNTWTVISNATSITAYTAPGTPAGIAANVSGAAVVSFGFTLSSAAGGSPDTATIRIIQTAGACPGGRNFVGGTSTLPSMSVPPIQAYSDSMAASFSASSGVVTNPAILSGLIHANVNTAPTSDYFDRAMLSCSAACIINIRPTTSLGTTCTAISAQNQRINTTGSNTTTNQQCTVQPSGTGLFMTLHLAAGIPVTVDLRGYIAQGSSGTGIQIEMNTALTGTASAVLFWYEK